MNVLALCAGVGGLEMGVRLACPEAKLVAAVEREAYAAAVLVARMEEGRLDPAPIWSDLRTFEGARWRGAVDLITAGYPCKGESSAGPRTGTDHEFWLWPEVWRVICEVEPRYIFLENVSAHLGRSFGHVLGDLSSCGWRVEWDCIPATAVGAPHRRDRVFVLAANPRRSRLEGERLRGTTAQCTTSNSHGDGLKRSGELLDEEWQTQRNDTDGLLVPWGSYWRRTKQPQPRVRRVDDGLANRLDRLYVIGNGVVPQQAARAWRTLWGRLIG